MKYIIFLLFVALSCDKVQSLKMEDMLSVANGTRSVCSEVFSQQTSRYLPYEEEYTKSFLGIFKKKKTRINWKKEYYTNWHKKDVCCEGYMELNGMCIAQCQPNCENGYCYKPDTCHCNSGYNKSPVKPDNICEPVCDNECIQGTCIRPNICSCDDGYKLEADNFTCTPDCYGICDETEYCAGPKDCQCIAGYKQFELITKQPITSFKPWDFNSSYYSDEEKTVNVSSTSPTISIQTSNCVPICNRPCVNSDCIAPNVCQCHNGYAEIENDVFECTPVCNKFCHFGTCTAPETCTCNEGYNPSKTFGSHVCEPICSEPCINGICTAPETCSCLEGYAITEMVDAYNFSYNCEPICSQTCKNGRCTEPETCTCNPGYEINAVNDSCVFICECINGFCIEPNVTCHCNSGYTLLDNGNATYCAPKCDNGCDNGICFAPQVCECHNGYVFSNDTKGNVSCISACETCVNGICLAQQRKCQCFHGWDGDYCDKPFLCSIEINETDHLRLMQNGIDIKIQEVNISDERFYYPWEKFYCSNEYSSKISNNTDCYLSQEMDDSNTSKIMCFLNIDLRNDTNGITKNNVMLHTMIGMPVILGSIIISLVILPIMLLIGKRKKLKRDYQLYNAYITIRHRLIGEEN